MLTIGGGVLPNLDEVGRTYHYLKEDFMGERVEVLFEIAYQYGDLTIRYRSHKDSSRALDRRRTEIYHAKKRS